VTKIVAGAAGGKTTGSKMIASPLWASNKAWRSVFEPLFAVLVIVNNCPHETGVGSSGYRVGSGGV